MICAQFGKDLFNISKVIGRKKSGPVFFDSQCTCRDATCVVCYYGSGLTASLHNCTWLQDGIMQNTVYLTHTTVSHPNLAFHLSLTLWWMLVEYFEYLVWCNYIGVGLMGLFHDMQTAVKSTLYFHSVIFAEYVNVSFFCYN